MLNKKLVLVGSGIASIILLGINYLGTDNFCGINRGCIETLANTLRILFVLIPLFILSLITYKMRDEIFHSWLTFTYLWIPLTLIGTLLAPEYSPSLIPITKGVVSFLMSALFLLISLILILVKHFSLHKNSIQK